MEIFQNPLILNILINKIKKVTETADKRNKRTCMSSMENEFEAEGLQRLAILSESSVAICKRLRLIILKKVSMTRKFG